ncbi:hypothetical protein [Mycolicibacterium sp. 120270]|uniref:hypothetical protein n=1 Tax=Mycolicibacterium sp. 120270 TaxID=3090600 RepID=UPI00299DD02D|nr:hypothetical protein [Mycolicibacterium sp. 120270]MDX1882038.1 hypothetical protein [Mycolicibacterium sp. 120270]
MTAPNPLALLNRVRPKSCPAQERWSLSIGDAIADVVRAPDPLRRVAKLLNHFGGVALSADAVEFDGDDVEWSDVTEIRTRNLVGYLLSDAIDKQADRLPLPWFPGRGLVIDAVGAAVLTALVAVAGDQIEHGALDVRIPAEVHHRGVLRDKELSPGVLAALVLTDPAVRECLQETARAHGVEVLPSDDDPVDAAAKRADRIKSALSAIWA